MLALSDAQGCVDTVRKNRDAAIAAMLFRTRTVIEFDKSGNIVHANDLFLNVMGYAPEDALGKHHSIFIHPSERNTPEYAEFWRIPGNVGLHEGELRRIAADGRDVWISATYAPFHDDAGRHIGVVKVAQDITAKQQTIIALMTAMTSLANGDLSARVEGHAKSELDGVADTFNAAVGTIRRMIEGGKSLCDALLMMSDTLKSGWRMRRML